MEQLQIRMFGDFSLQYGNALISDGNNRAKKVWELMALLIGHRGQPVPQKKLIDQLWGSDTASANPENTLRITLHRARTLLDTLADGLGHQLILRKSGGYMWRDDIPVSIDCDRFEMLCLPEVTDEEQRLAEALEALSLYRGEFLAKQSSAMWVIPLATYFQKRFLAISVEAIDLLCHRERYPEAAEICRSAIATEPYHEPLHCSLMEILALMGDQKGAAEVYDSLSRRLFNDFGIRPSEETREVYRNSAHAPENRDLPLDEVIENLQEPESLPGAMVCDYDYFKVLCYAESRSMERSGNVTHVALLNIASNTDAPLNKRSLNRIMEQLGLQLRKNLRRGDIISQCSISQYIIMLPNANYEDSCMVCRRVTAAFHRAHPHVTAKVNFIVQPLTPSLKVP